VRENECYREKPKDFEEEEEEVEENHLEGIH
jgi:hypothetical protein